MVRADVTLGAQGGAQSAALLWDGDRHCLREHHAGIGRHLRRRARSLPCARDPGRLLGPQSHCRRPESRRLRRAPPSDKASRRRSESMRGSPTGAPTSPGALRRRERHSDRASAASSIRGRASTSRSPPRRRSRSRRVRRASQQTTLRAGGGTIALSGQAGAQIDLTATLTNVPAALANSFAPTLGAEGSVSGTVNAKGPAASPNATFTIALANASVAASRNAGLGPLAVSDRRHVREQDSHLEEPGQRSGRAGGQPRGNGWHCAKCAAQDARSPEARRCRSATPSLPRAAPRSRGHCKLDIAVVRHGLGAEILRPRDLRGRRLCRSRHRYRAAQPAACRDLLGRSRRGGAAATPRAARGRFRRWARSGLTRGPAFRSSSRVKVRAGALCRRHARRRPFRRRPEAHRQFVGGPLLVGTVTLDRTEITVPERLPRDSVAVDVKHVDPPPR